MASAPSITSHQRGSRKRTTTSCLSRYQDKLRELFRADPELVKPRSRYNEALSFIEQGLEDISISR